jgi:hypothetical protein
VVSISKVLRNDSGDVSELTPVSFAEMSYTSDFSVVDTEDVYWCSKNPLPIRAIRWLLSGVLVLGIITIWLFDNLEPRMFLALSILGLFSLVSTIGLLELVHRSRCHTLKYFFLHKTEKVLKLEISGEELFAEQIIEFQEIRIVDFNRIPLALTVVICLKEGRKCASPVFIEQVSVFCGKGLSAPTMNVAEKLANFFGVSLNRFDATNLTSTQRVVYFGLN